MATDEKVSSSVDPSTLPNLDMKVYWAMDQLEDGSNDRFSSTVIARHLIESANISTSRQAVESALKRNKKTCHKNVAGYKLMAEGKVALKEYIRRDGVIFLDATKPYSAKNHALRKILGDGYIEVSICDPYVDQKTLDIIFANLKKGVPVRILTSTVNDKPAGTFKRQLEDLRKEGFDVEVRVYDASTLHDRYIMTSQHFWLSGTSLNSLGQKESFIVLLGDDIRQSMTATFNNRWKVSPKI